MVCGGKLDESLNEKSLIFRVAQPDLFPRFVAVPKLTAVEQANAVSEFLTIFGRHFHFPYLRGIKFLRFFLSRTRRFHVAIIQKRNKRYNKGSALFHR